MFLSSNIYINFIYLSLLHVLPTTLGEMTRTQYAFKFNKEQNGSKTLVLH